MLKKLGRLLRKLFKAVAGLGAVGRLVVVLFVASLWVEHTLSVELPPPTGPFAVGRVSATWVDTGREDPFAPQPADDRELAVWIWYPAQRSDGTPTAEYLSGPVRSRLAEVRGVVLNHFILRHPEKVHVHSTENAELAPAEQTYPVVIFNSGIGVLALEYSTPACASSSHRSLLYLAISSITSLFQGINRAKCSGHSDFKHTDRCENIRVMTVTLC
ncbi:MAG: hypothetical protein IH921_10340 [Gemmatimonadetes bacterium]|nr:hypothetical protein [Gemmatimonadota bacterium]